MLKEQPAYVKISITLPETLKDQIDQIAKDANMTRSHAIRELCKIAIEQSPKGRN